ncbi:MAG: recombinase family protein [Planctomycetaceae bacterium]|nr:recombinase family protein [Planctomycetaceae bacterium]
MIRAVGYIRRSTDKQDLSLEQQEAKLREYALSQGWEMVEVFADDAVSGSEMDRPGLKRLLDYAERVCDVGAVVAWDRNRLARPKDPMDGMLLERRLIGCGKRVVYAATGQEADRSFAGGLLGYVEHYQNGDYLRKLSRDTMRGLVNRAQRGLWTGGPIPYGYDRLIVDQDGAAKRIVRDMPDRSQVVLSPERGEVVETVAAGRRYSKQEHELCTLVPSESARVRAVQRMFCDYAAGKPIRKLRDELNRTGLRTARGRIFTAATIHHMLENHAYAGVCVYNQRTESKWHRLTGGQSRERQDEGLETRPEADWIVTEDAWAALVDRETFEAVQKRRKASKIANVRMTGNKVHSENLLTGLFFCGVCGGKMFGWTKRNSRGYGKRYYTCATHHRGDEDACPKRYSIPAELVEDHILGLIRQDLRRLADDDKLHEYVAQEVQRLTGGQADAKRELQQRLAEVDQRAARLRDHLKSLDTQTAETLGLYSEARELAQQRMQVECDLADARKGSPELPDLGEIRDKAAEAFERLEDVLTGGTIEEKRELIGLYVQTIKAEPDSYSVQISLYPAMFTAVLAGGGFEPPTSGL